MAKELLLFSCRRLRAGVQSRFVFLGDELLNVKALQSCAESEAFAGKVEMIIGLMKH